MADTAIAEAFRRAQWKGPNARLHAIATAALEAAEKNAKAPTYTPNGEARDRLRTMAVKAMEDARFNLNVARGLLLEALMNDAPALNAMMGDTVPKRAAQYLHEVWNEEHGEKHGGHGPLEDQWAIAANGGGQKDLEARSASAPAALSPERVEAGKARARSWFDRETVRGRPIGDITYGEMEASARRSISEGIDNLRQAYLQRRLFNSVPYNAALANVPARKWADEKVLAEAARRWAELEQHGRTLFEATDVQEMLPNEEKS